LKRAPFLPFEGGKKRELFWRRKGKAWGRDDKNGRRPRRRGYECGGIGKVVLWDP